MTTDLTTWLHAQLDDDERVARIAEQLRGAHWTDAIVTHIARWDPARVLAEVDAKRRILDEYEQSAERNPLINWEVSEMDGLEIAIRLLALPYADRPGYRTEWRP